MKFWFSAILVFFCLFLTWDLAALDWDLVSEDFDKDFGALTKIEHLRNVMEVSRKQG